MHGFQDIEVQDTKDMAHCPSTQRFPSPPPHGGLFIATFVVAHLAALGVAYASAALQVQAHGLPTAAHHDEQAVHHLGRMRLVPLQVHTPSTH